MSDHRIPPPSQGDYGVLEEGVERSDPPGVDLRSTRNPVRPDAPGLGGTVTGTEYADGNSVSPSGTGRESDTRVWSVRFTG